MLESPLHFSIRPRCCGSGSPARTRAPHPRRRCRRPCSAPHVRCSRSPRAPARRLREEDVMSRDPSSGRRARRSLRLFSLVVSWLVMGVALMVAAGLLPGVSVESFWGALLVAAIVAALNAIVPPVLAALRLPLTLVLGFLLVLLADAVDPARRRRADRWHPDRRRLRLGAADVAGGRGCERRARGPARHRRHGLDPDRAADRAPAGDHRPHRRPRDHLPRDRRARAAGAAPRDARRQRADDGPLDGRRHAPPGRVGDRPLLADRRQPGRDPARLQRGHPGVPLGREGDRAR